MDDIFKGLNLNCERYKSVGSKINDVYYDWQYDKQP